MTGPKRLPIWQALIIAAVILDLMRAGIEENAPLCNRLSENPHWAGHLTCQKTYRYQPDPFTG